MRRVYLDVIGLSPTVDEYQRFMSDTAPDKRAKLIDQLLQRDEFAELWTSKWGEMVKVRGEAYTPARQRRQGGRGVLRMDSPADDPGRAAG